MRDKGDYPENLQVVCPNKYCHFEPFMGLDLKPYRLAKCALRARLLSSSTREARAHVFHGIRSKMGRVAFRPGVSDARQCSKNPVPFIVSLQNSVSKLKIKSMNHFKRL